MAPKLGGMIEILGGARLWQDAAKGAQAVHASSQTSLAWKQGFIHWATVSKSKKTLTLRILIVSVELGTLSVAYLGSGMLHVTSGSVRRIPARSNLAAWAQSEITQGSSAVVTYGTRTRPSWTARSHSQRNAGITPIATGLDKTTGFEAQSESSSKTNTSAERTPKPRRDSLDLILNEDRVNIARSLLPPSIIVGRYPNSLRVQHLLSQCRTGMFLTGILVGLLILIIDDASNGSWWLLLAHSLIFVTVLLTEIFILLETPVLHMRKANRIRTALSRACRGWEGNTQLSLRPGTWRCLHQYYVLGSNMVLIEVYKQLRAMVECPLEKGKTRIRWQCVSRLFDQPGIPAVANLSSTAVNAYMMIMWSSDVARQRNFKES